MPARPLLTLARPLFLPSVAVVALGAACASEQVRWDDAAETVATTATAASTEAAAKPVATKPISAREYAARFPSDVDCAAEVQRLGKRNVDLALQLLRACVERGDFRRLGAVVDGDWVPALVRRPEAPALCARVVAARSGDVDADVMACQRAGYAVATLEQLSADPEKAAGRFVIARVRRDDEHKSKKETRLVEVRLDEREPASLPTGRRLAATFGPTELPPGEAVLLGRVVKVTDDALVGDGELLTVVDVIASAPVAERPTF
jgi:hypothetical protein